MFLGEMIFIRDGWKTLINGDFKSPDGFGISQKDNPQIPKNDTFSFWGSVFGNVFGSVDIRMTRGWEDL